jgi:hypothetical protein
VETFTAHSPFHRQLLEDKPDKARIRRAKQFLDFFTIMYFSNIQISNQKLIIEFLEATIEYLRRESAAKQSSTLSASFLSCLTAFQRGQPGIKICDTPLLSDPEIIWQVAMDSATPDLALACKSRCNFRNVTFSHLHASFICFSYCLLPQTARTPYPSRSLELFAQGTPANRFARLSRRRNSPCPRCESVNMRCPLSPAKACRRTHRCARVSGYPCGILIQAQLRPIQRW